MKLSRDILLAYVEGSLPPDESRRVADEVAKDGELHAYVEEQKRLNARLQTAFAPRPEGPPVPEPAPAAQDKARKPSLASRFKFDWPKFDGFAPAKLAPHWIPAAAMTAGLVLGALLAASFGTGADIRAQGGRLTAQGNLARVLTAQLSFEAGGDVAPARAGASFFGKDGYFCRSFESLGPQGALAGIACRENGVWRIAALAEAERREATPLRPAGFDTPASVRAAMSAMMVGEVLNEDAERAARAQGWRPR